MIDESKIIVAVISALSALTGAFLSQFLVFVRDKMDKSHKRNVFLREKYEEMSYLTISAQEWMASAANAKSLSNLSSKPPVDARKALVLANIYFPKLREPTQEFLNACVNFQMVLIDNHEFKEDISVGAQAAHKNQAAFEQSSEAISSAVRILDDNIIKYAKKYAKA